MNKHEEELSAIKERLTSLEGLRHYTLEMCPNCKHHTPMIEGVVCEGDKFYPSWELFINIDPVFPHKQCAVCGKIWEHGLREVEVGE